VVSSWVSFNFGLLYFGLWLGKKSATFSTTQKENQKQSWHGHTCQLHVFFFRAWLTHCFWFYDTELKTTLLQNFSTPNAECFLLDSDQIKDAFNIFTIFKFLLASKADSNFLSTTQCEHSCNQSSKWHTNVNIKLW